VQVSPKAVTAWKCPTCGRRFARPRQAHSCQVVSLDAHLKQAGPEVVAVFDEIVRCLRACGPLDVVPTKTNINFLSGTSLGGVRLLRRKARLGILLTRQVRDRRIHGTLQLSPRSVMHYIELAKVAEVDATVRSWLREAHETGMLAGQRARDGS
jgi:hypothetical protein